MTIWYISEKCNGVWFFPSPSHSTCTQRRDARNSAAQHTLTDAKGTRTCLSAQNALARLAHTQLLEHSQQICMCTLRGGGGRGHDTYAGITLLQPDTAHTNTHPPTPPLQKLTNSAVHMSHAHAAHTHTHPLDLISCRLVTARDFFDFVCATCRKSHDPINYTHTHIRALRVVAVCTGWLERDVRGVQAHHYSTSACTQTSVAFLQTTNGTCGRVSHLSPEL